MQRMLRIVLLCLLVIGLPLKGQATACMTMAPAHDHAAHRQHHGGHAGQAGAAAAGDQAEHEHIDHAQDHAADAKAASEHKASCSACAACCFAAGITTGPALIDFALPHLRDPAPPAPLMGLVRLGTGGLERPPRTHLA